MARVLSNLWDAALDRSLLGYTSIGFRARRRSGRLVDPPVDALRGKVAAVTGAAGGLGKAAALGLAELGAQVRLVVRHRERGELAAEEIRVRVPGAEVAVDRCDVSSLASVRDYAATAPPLHALVHNAGVMPPTRTVTAEGHEACLATHVLGPHLMTSLLLEQLRAAGQARVIWVSSGGMYAQSLDLDDLEYTAVDYSPTTAYARTKRMQVALAREWATRLGPGAVTVHSMHPGWADTPGVAEALPGFRRVVGPVLRTPEQGADTVAWLAAAPLDSSETGGFWHDRTRRPEHYVPWTRESAADRARLFDLCDQITGAP